MERPRDGDYQRQMTNCALLGSRQPRPSRIGKRRRQLRQRHRRPGEASAGRGRGGQRPRGERQHAGGSWRQLSSNRKSQRVDAGNRRCSWRRPGNRTGRSCPSAQPWLGKWRMLRNSSSCSRCRCNKFRRRCIRSTSRFSKKSSSSSRHRSSSSSSSSSTCVQCARSRTSRRQAKIILLGMSMHSAPRPWALPQMPSEAYWHQHRVSRIWVWAPTRASSLTARATPSSP